jgi:hypothetical protein
MRVKIAYSVELEEAERELSEIGGGIVDKLRDVTAKIDEAFNLLVEEKNSYSRSTAIIDEARRSLAGADATLSDLQNVVAALQGFYEGDRNVRDGRSGMDTARNLSNAEEK